MTNLTLEKAIGKKPIKTEASLIINSIREEVCRERKVTPEEAIQENLNIFYSNPHLVEMAYDAIEDGNFEKLANCGLNMDYLSDSINQFYDRNVDYEKAFTETSQTLFSVARNYLRELYNIFKSKANHLE